MENKFKKLDSIIDELKVRKFKKFIKTAEKDIRKYVGRELSNEDSYKLDGLNFVQCYNRINYDFDRRIIFYINLKDSDSLNLIKKSGFCVEYTTFLNEAIFHPVSSKLWSRHKYFEDLTVLESLSCGRRIITYDHIHISYKINDPSRLYSLSHCIKDPANLLNNLSFLVEQTFFKDCDQKNFCINITRILNNFGAVVYNRKAQLYDNNDIIVLTNTSTDKVDNEVKSLYKARIVSINFIYDSIWHEQLVKLDTYLL
uniref:BRCT domain-containing protein n=1 Tax=Strongyloides papillosus TaxID=174720 RepID=A0A0N5CE77_STREA